MRRSRPAEIENTVRILGVVASPDGLPQLDVAQERKRVDDALGKAAPGSRGHDRLARPGHAARRSGTRSSSGDYHILHFVGHSGYVTESDSRTAAGVAVCSSSRTRTAAPRRSPMPSWSILLADQDSLRLVVLNSCEGARTTP